MIRAGFCFHLAGWCFRAAGRPSSETVTGELAVADAHPNGAHPWRFDDYAGKFRALTAPLLPEEEAEAFIAMARRLPELKAAELRRLNPALPAGTVTPDGADGKGIFDYGLG